jgi:hypothetical protein
MTEEEALTSEDAEEEWRRATDSEMKNLTNLGTWIVINREDMQPDQRTVDSKWTFINLNGELIVHNLFY